MVHSILIVLHALSGIVSFIAGSILVFKPKQLANFRLFYIYIVFLIFLVIFMSASVTVGWAKHTSSERFIFPALCLLGFYMLYRAYGALKALRSQAKNWKVSYIDHIGFTLISLFEGFVIVAAIDLSSPGWLVAVLAVLGVVVGSRTIAFAKSQV